MKSRALFAVLLSLMCLAIAGAQEHSWKGIRFRLSYKLSETVGERDLLLSARKGNVYKSFVLDYGVSKHAQVFFLRGSTLQVILEDGRALRWYRLYSNLRWKKMKAPWRVDCGVMAVSARSMVVWCQPLLGNKVIYYVYNPSTETWMALDKAPLGGRPFSVWSKRRPRKAHLQARP